MAFRRKMGRRHSRRTFAKHAVHVRRKNSVRPMRGGFRI